MEENMRLRVLFFVLMALATLSLMAQNTGLYFDGVDDCVAIGSMTSQITTTFTVEMWINPATVAVGSGELPTYGRTLIASSTGTDKPLWLSLRGSEIWVRTFTGNNPVLQTTGAAIPANAWTHIAVSATRSGQTHLYINGVEYGTGVNSGTQYVWNNTACLGDLRPGRLLPFWGAMDEVRIWNDIRTPQEIQTYMNTTIDPSSSGLVAYYMLNESSGSVAEDSAGNYDGQTRNGLTVNNNPQWLAEGPTLPVELSSFTAVLMIGNNVKIMWVTQSETDLQGYYILRSRNQDLNDAVKVSDLIISQNSSNQTSYSYTDEEVFDNGLYYYWLQSLNLDGSFDYHGPVSVNVSQDNPEAPVIPQSTSLVSVYPNPFNPQVQLRYYLETPTAVAFSIYNTKGQLIRSWQEGDKAAGTYQSTWDGNDNLGSACSSGIYLVKMQAGKQTSMKKAILAK